MAILLLAISLCACVTSFETPQQKKIDTQQALEANIKLGMTYLQQNNREGALRSFSKALELNKKSAEAHQGMALIHQMNGEFTQAEASYKKALKGQSDFSRAGVEFSYGRMLYEQGRFKEANPLFEDASTDMSYPRRPEALLYVGRTALMLENVERAKGAFQHSLNLDPRQAQSALELADMAFADRDYSAAKNYLDQFSKNSRHSPRSLWLGIRIERVFGNKDKESSYVLALKNLYPYSKEYLEYKRFSEL